MNAFTDRALAAGYPSVPGFKEPTTSKEAAEAMGPTSRQLRIDALRWIAGSPHTADEIAVRLAVDILVARPRVSELRKYGFVTPLRKENGKQERRPNESGKSAIVWKATDAGIDALREGTVR